MSHACIRWLFGVQAWPDVPASLSAVCPTKTNLLSAPFSAHRSNRGQGPGGGKGQSRLGVPKAELNFSHESVSVDGECTHQTYIAHLSSAYAFLVTQPHPSQRRAAMGDDPASEALAWQLYRELNGLPRRAASRRANQDTLLSLDSMRRAREAKGDGHGPSGTGRGREDSHRPNSRRGSPFEAGEKRRRRCDRGESGSDEEGSAEYSQDSALSSGSQSLSDTQTGPSKRHRSEGQGHVHRGQLGVFGLGAHYTPAQRAMWHNDLNTARHARSRRLHAHLCIHVCMQYASSRCASHAWRGAMARGDGAHVVPRLHACAVRQLVTACVGRA